MEDGGEMAEIHVSVPENEVELPDDFYGAKIAALEAKVISLEALIIAQGAHVESQIDALESNVEEAVQQAEQAEEIVEEVLLQQVVEDLAEAPMEAPLEKTEREEEINAAEIESGPEEDSGAGAIQTEETADEPVVLTIRPEPGPESERSTKRYHPGRFGPRGKRSG